MLRKYFELKETKETWPENAVSDPRWRPIIEGGNAIKDAIESVEHLNIDGRLEKREY